MLDTLFWIAVGAFVGWNFPQPFWAKIVQEKMAGANNGGIAPAVPTPSFGSPAPVSTPATSFGGTPLGGNSVSTAPAFTPAPAPSFGSKPVGPGRAEQPEL